MRGKPKKKHCYQQKKIVLKIVKTVWAATLKHNGYQKEMCSSNRFFLSVHFFFKKIFLKGVDDRRERDWRGSLRWGAGVKIKEDVMHGLLQALSLHRRPGKNTSTTRLSNPGG